MICQSVFARLLTARAQTASGVQKTSLCKPCAQSAQRLMPAACPLRVQSVLCGQPAALTLHTADAYGNVCTSGGHDVAFVYQAAGGTKAYKVSPFLHVRSEIMLIGKHLVCA